WSSDVCSSDLYQVMENPGWQESQAVQLLSAEDQQELRADLGELLFLLAQGKVLQSKMNQDAAERRREVEEALEWNSAAQKCYGADQGSRALTLQRADLEALLGHQEEANRLRD